LDAAALPLVTMTGGQLIYALAKGSTGKILLLPWRRLGEETAWNLSIMESSRMCLQAARAVSSALPQADGGCIYGDAPNAGTSAVATVHPASTPRSIFMRQDIGSWPASSREKLGFTTIGLGK
jgi:hypothetical protein